MSEPKVTELKLGSGVDIRVKPLSPFVFQKLREKAAQLYPPPDPKEYEIEPDEGVMAIPGDKIPATQNPAYREKVEAAEAKQKDWLTLAVVTMAAEFSESQSELIERFAEQLDTMRSFIDLPEDAWEATLYYGIITSEVERQVIVAAAESRLALTEEEVADGRRLFRSQLSLETYSRLALSGTSGVQGRVRSQS